ncbi:MAG: outer membrane protein assembly factor BamD, partial [Bacteroidales bacterium]|nr:outer membrane protein assembly factor BamD [Bacteroidales bacterium]
YNKAASLFESCSLATKGTPQEDTVQFYWAMSNYKYKDYVTAESNFSQFISIFPRSPFTEEAEFLRIDCLYRATHRYELDQSPTYTAMTAIDRFILSHPGSQYEQVCREMLKTLADRVDKKNFEAARLYYHMEDYMAAHYAFKNVLKQDAENIYREDILYFTAMSAYKYALNSVEEKRYERYLTFLDDYYNFVSEYPESEHRKELDTIFDKVDKIVKQKQNS